jgi:hypothetical protein
MERTGGFVDVQGYGVRLQSAPKNSVRKVNAGLKTSAPSASEATRTDVLDQFAHLAEGDTPQKANRQSSGGTSLPVVASGGSLF